MRAFRDLLRMELHNGTQKGQIMWKNIMIQHFLKPFTLNLLQKTVVQLLYTSYTVVNQAFNEPHNAFHHLQASNKSQIRSKCQKHTIYNIYNTSPQKTETNGIMTSNEKSFNKLNRASSLSFVLVN